MRRCQGFIKDWQELPASRHVHGNHLPQERRPLHRHQRRRGQRTGRQRLNSPKKFIQRMDGARHEQENQSSIQIQRHERQAHHQPARLRVLKGRGRALHHRRGSRPGGTADFQPLPCGERPDQDRPYAHRAGNPHAGDAGIPQDGQHPPLLPGLPQPLGDEHRRTHFGAPGVSGAYGELQDREGFLQGQDERPQPGGKAGHFREHPRANH